MLQKLYKVLKSERQLRPIRNSYAQVMAVTIKHTLQLRPMTSFLVWQLRSIRRNFLFPKSAISDSAIAVSYVQKSTGPMTLRAPVDGERGALLTQSKIVWTLRVRCPPFWLIITALDRNCCLAVIMKAFEHLGVHTCAEWCWRIQKVLSVYKICWFGTILKVS